MGRAAAKMKAVVAAFEAAERGALPVNASIWYACAGPAGEIPTVGSRVNYFPQGHAEHSSSAPDFSGVQCTKAYFLCRVVAVHHLVDPRTDDVFARITLDPVNPADSPPANNPNAVDGDIRFSVKVLTQSDANKGGAFTVPKCCADSVFPPLDLATSSGKPEQNLNIRDLLGNTYTFRHVFRGMPKRHLLTTGWSDFVDAKKLVTGDSLVFIKNGDGELFVGIRRQRRSLFGNLGMNEGNRVLAKSVVEAARLAESNRPFEVDYYLHSGSSEFLVADGKVTAALAVEWRVGARVKLISPAAPESSRGYEGTLLAVSDGCEGPWAHSPWRMLKVIWDDKSVMQNDVCPWQVVMLPENVPIESSYPALKRHRSVSPELLVGEGSRTPILHNLFPVGIQGARQLRSNNSDPCFKDMSQGEILTQENQHSIQQHHGTELVNSGPGNLTKQGSNKGIILFGTICYPNQTIATDVSRPTIKRASSANLAAWDDKSVMQNNVRPWQVGLLPENVQIESSCLVPKKHRSQSAKLLTNGGSNMMVGSLTPSLLDLFPVDIHGAKQELGCQLRSNNSDPCLEDVGKEIQLTVGAGAVQPAGPTPEGKELQLTVGAVQPAEGTSSTKSTSCDF